MDHYAYILDEFRQDDFRRLRAFAGEGRGKFTTWLVVVARRLCVDHHRHAHGRSQPGQNAGHTESVDHIARRNLADLVAGEIDWECIEDRAGLQPDTGVQKKEQRQALLAAVERLDIADQLLLKLRFEDDIPIGTVGPMVGMDSRWQVHRRLKLVLARLRDELEAGGFTEP
jgi:RNA polymerase sigma factor (sigma-70 family)